MVSGVVEEDHTRGRHLDVDREDELKYSRGMLVSKVPEFEILLKLAIRFGIYKFKQIFSSLLKILKPLTIRAI